MRDLWIHDDDLIVATHGRGFWILDDIEPLREASPALGNSAHLFKPAPAYRMQRDVNTDTPLPPDEPAAKNPPDGAILDYYLSSAATKVTIEIEDAQGKLVRKFSSDDKPESTQEELEKQLIPLYWLRKFTPLSTDAGMHRWIWDLHYPSPNTNRHEYPIAAVPHDTPRYPLGPTAVPGTYSIKLTVDGKTSTSSLTVKMDPRIKTLPADLQKKFQLESQLASMLSKSTTALQQAASIRKQLSELKGSDSASHANAESAQKKLDDVVGGQGGPGAPASTKATLSRVNGDAGTLYQMLWGSDAAPTRTQTTAITALTRDEEDVTKRWQEFKNSDLTSLNRSLRQANIGEIKVEAMPEEEEQIDEE
jgi:hypothetical protein